MNLVASQLELTNGTRRDRGDCMLDAEGTTPPPVIARRGALYILTETETMAAGQPRPGDIDLCREAQEIIVREFYNFNASATVTSALRHALEKANQAIFNHNSAILPPERRGLGLSVTVVRGQELFMAQLPPTQAYISHGGQISYLPAAPLGPRPVPAVPRPAAARTGTDPQATLPMPSRQALPALGRYSAIEPTLTRNVFEEGDLLVLCSSGFATALGADGVEWALSNSDSRSTLLNLSEFARTNGISDGYALTVGARAEFASRSTTPRRQSPATERPTAPQEADLYAGPRSKSQTGPSGSNNPPGEDLSAASRNLAASLGDRPTTRRPAQPHPAPDEGLEDNPLAPLVENRTKDPWLAREDDDLNRPAYLRGRTLSPEPPGPVSANGSEIRPANSQKQPTGTFKVGQSTDPAARRNFSYTDASEEAGYSRQPTDRMSALPPPPPGFEETTHAPASQDEGATWGSSSSSGRRERPSLRPGFFNRGQPANEVATSYSDLMDGDGYGPPSDGKRPRRRAPFKLGFNRNWLLAGAGVVVGLILVAVLIGFLRGGSGGDEAKTREFLQSAEQKRAQAQQLAASDPARARALLTQAQADLDTARQQKAAATDLQTAQTALTTTLNNVNRVTVPADIRQAIDLSSQGQGVRLSKGLLDPTGDRLYLLDSGRGALYSTDTQGAVKTLLKNGDKAGGAVFGKPVAMAARPDGLMVLDDGNIVWIYNKNTGGWTAQALGGTAGWNTKGSRMAASFQGNLYLLGTGKGQILKYNAGAYTANPDEWLDPGLVESLNLDSSAGFSIDGTIYTLSPEGKIVQLARPGGKDKGAVVQQFDLKAGNLLGPPLSQPVALNVGSLEFPFFFVVDAEKRVLQFNKANGSFVQQFQAAPGRKEFDNVQDVIVDETNQRLYLVGLQKVQVMSLPVGPGGTATPASGTTPQPSGQPNRTPNPSTSPQPNSNGNTNVTIITGQPTVRP